MLRPFARGFTPLIPALMGKNVICPSLIRLFGSVEKERLLLSNSLAGIASKRIFFMKLLVAGQVMQLTTVRSLNEI